MHTEETNIRDERLQQAHETLSQGLQHVQDDPETLAAYLRFRAHFRSYSAQNTLLILEQRPTACYVMGFAQWKKHGRHVMKGEKGLAIFAPILRRPTNDEVLARGLDPEKDRILVTFKVTYVWDITQTAVIPGCEETALQYASPIPKLGGDDFAGLLCRLETVAGALGYTVMRFANRLEEGYCSYSRREIGLRIDHAPNDACAVLAHELAHALAHAERRDLGHAERELQAEGAAYLFSYALGLDTARASLPYLKHYAKDDTALISQLGAIEQIAGALMNALDRVP